MVWQKQMPTLPVLTGDSQFSTCTYQYISPNFLIIIKKFNIPLGSVAKSRIIDSYVQPFSIIHCMNVNVHVVRH